MLRTPLCDLLGIDVPIIGAPFGPWEQVGLAAAICEAGALGSLGTAVRSPPELEAQWARLRALTDRPFAVNHTARPLDEAAFTATLVARPRAISFHLAVPADLVARAHDAGILWIQQVVSAPQAEEALAAGADVLVAQGGEAGGNSGFVATLVLVPQVVDLAGDVPVVAAGGIADGRGVAAALTLGASAVSIGTAFLRCTEANTHPAWANALAELEPEGTTLTRALTGRLARAVATDFVKAVASPDAPRPAPYPIQRALTAAMKEAGAAAGDHHRMQLWAGQSAAMARPIPAADFLSTAWRDARALL